MTLAYQPSFEEMGTPLFDVTFCVVDLETTGGSASGDAITEIGAVKVRGGEVIGEFQTLVNPGAPIPASIVVLTGITQAMVISAPPVEEVLPSFLEFLGDAVFVAHNSHFDLGFLNAAAVGLDYGKLPNRTLDTVALATAAGSIRGSQPQAPVPRRLLSVTGDSVAPSAGRRSRNGARPPWVARAGGNAPCHPPRGPPATADRQGLTSLRQDRIDA